MTMWTFLLKRKKILMDFDVVNNLQEKSDQNDLFWKSH